MACPAGLPPALPPEQPHELLDCKTCVADDAAEGTGPDLLVVGNDDSGVWHVAPQNHVTARLPAEYEARPFQGGPWATPSNKRIDCGCMRRAFVRLRIRPVSPLAFAASKSASNQASSQRTQSYTEYATEFHRVRK
jgi:hypothetical protein